MEYAQSKTGITTVATMEAKKRFIVLGFPNMASIRVVRYKLTSRMTPMMAKICFIFFMVGIFLFSGFAAHDSGICRHAAIIAISSV